MTLEHLLNVSLRGEEAQVLKMFISHPLPELQNPCLYIQHIFPIVDSLYTFQMFEISENT